MSIELVNYLKKITVSMLFLALVGCSGSSVKPATEIGKQFNIGNVSLTIAQRLIPKTTYHTEIELQQLLIQKLKECLEQRGLLSYQAVAKSLTIQVVYYRNFLNEQTTTSPVALAYPNYDYDIKVMDGVAKLAQISQKNKAFKGRFIMNIDVLAGRLKKKSDEVVFIEGLAKDIVRSVQKFKG